MSSEIQPPNNLSVNSLRIGIVAAKFNTVLADSLLQEFLNVSLSVASPKNLPLNESPAVMKSQLHSLLF